jgi:glycosyltransferase involved in cell wall biosynthesis
MRIVALVPAYNEADRIVATVTATRDVSGVARVLVIDDGSTDGTADLARQAGAQVLRLERNSGKGGALQAGLDLVRADADIVLLLDADLGETASEGAKLLEPLLSGDADMTIAVLPKPPGSGGFGLVKGLARRGIARLGGGFAVSAPLSGQRALTLRAWEAATPFASGYGAEVALTIRALRAGLHVLEVPVTMTHSATGRTAAGFAHRGRQFVHVALTLARLALGRS